MFSGFPGQKKSSAADFLHHPPCALAPTSAGLQILFFSVSMTDDFFGTGYWALGTAWRYGACFILFHHNFWPDVKPSIACLISSVLGPPNLFRKEEKALMWPLAIPTRGVALPRDAYFLSGKQFRAAGPDFDWNCWYWDSIFISTWKGPILWIFRKVTRKATISCSPLLLSTSHALSHLMFSWAHIDHTNKNDPINSW